MAGQSDKHKSSQAGRTPFYERPPHQKESPLEGHLLRMPTDRLPRQVLYSQLPDGRPRDRPRLRYKDTIKRNPKKRDIDTNSWTSLALQRDVWRDTVK